MTRSAGRPKPGPADSQSIIQAIGCPFGLDTSNPQRSSSSLVAGYTHGVACVLFVIYFQDDLNTAMDKRYLFDSARFFSPVPIFRSGR